MTRWKTPAAAILAAAMALLFSPSPATADDGPKIVRLEVPKGSIPLTYLVADDSGKPISNYTVHTETTSTKQYLVFTIGPNMVVCGLWASPSPTYSWSNHTMHYGAQAQCDTPIPLKLRMSLWSGPDGDITQFQDNTPWKYGIRTLWDGRVRACLDWGSFAYWRLFAYAEGDTNYDGTYEPFLPYPGESTKYNECVDI